MCCPLWTRYFIFEQKHFFPPIVLFSQMKSWTDVFFFNHMLYCWWIQHVFVLVFLPLCTSLSLHNLRMGSGEITLLILAAVTSCDRGLGWLHAHLRSRAHSQLPHCRSLSVYKQVSYRWRGHSPPVVTRPADRRAQDDNPAAPIGQHNVCLSVCRGNNICLHWLQTVNDDHLKEANPVITKMLHRRKAAKAGMDFVVEAEGHDFSTLMRRGDRRRQDPSKWSHRCGCFSFSTCD